MLSHRHRSCGILCLCDVKDGKLIIEENTTNMVNIKVIDSIWVPQIGEYKKSIIVYSDNWNDYGYYTLFHMIYFDEQGFIKQIGSLKIYSKALDEPGNDICFVRTLLPDTIKTLNSKFCSLGFYETQYNGTCCCSISSIMKQKVFTPCHIGFCPAFRCIIGDLASSIQ